MKILIVDDHPLVRRGIAAVLESEVNIEGLKEAGNIGDALAIMSYFSPEITLVDLNLGREDGLELVKKSKNNNINTKFIVLTSSGKRDDFLRAQELGVEGYILKDAFAEDIVYAVNLIARGKRFFDIEMMESQINQKNEYLEDLTPREVDVLKELGQGLSNIEIAGRLYISEHTVKKHISNVLSKLNLSHRTEAALYINSFKKLG